MSSLRNSVQRRNHRERAQPRERQKWGILEKHKDYALRARDFNAKKARLRILREKAVERNPDEFHFGMMSSRSSGGVKITKRGDNRPLSVEVVKLLKTQDVAYLRTMLQRTRRERERMEEDGGLALVGGGSALLREGFEERRRRRVKTMEMKEDEEEEEGNDEKRSGKKGGKREGKSDGHIAFVGSREEQLMFGRDREGVKGSRNMKRVEGGDDEDPSNEDEEGRVLTTIDEDVDGTRSRNAGVRERSYLLDESVAKNRKRWREGKIRRYEALKSREQQLKLAEAELEMQRAKMSGNVGGVNKNGVKYKIRERKR